MLKGFMDFLLQQSKKGTWGKEKYKGPYEDGEVEYPEGDPLHRDKGPDWDPDEQFNWYPSMESRIDENGEEWVELADGTEVTMDEWHDIYDK